MIVVQIKTPFNISDLKASVLISFTLSFIFILFSVFLFPYPPNYVCTSPGLSTMEPTFDQFRVYRNISILVAFLSFIPSFLYYLSKNRPDSNTTTYVFLILFFLNFFWFTVLFVLLPVILNFFNVPSFSAKSVFVDC